MSEPSTVVYWTISKDRDTGYFAERHVSLDDWVHEHGATSSTLHGGTIECLRAHMIEWGMSRYPRRKGDKPGVLETWV